MFAHNDGKIDKDFGLTRGEVSFFLWKGAAVSTGIVTVRWSGGAFVQRSKRRSKEVRRSCFTKEHGSWSDQFQLGQQAAVCFTFEACHEVSGFEAMLELMLVYPNLKLSFPLATYADGERWRMWTRNQATAVSLRDLVGRQGVVSGEYVLHSGRIGGATRLAAGGVSTMDIQRQGRWKSDAFFMMFSGVVCSMYGRQ